VARTRTPEPAAPKRRFGRKPKADDGTPSGWVQFKQTLAIVQRHDRRTIPVAIAIGLVLFGIGLGVGFAVHHALLLGVLGFAVGLLSVQIFIGIRARKAVYADVADQRGVALQVVRKMRGDWKITEMVQFTRNQDFVHRVVGRPGIVLIAEGRPQAARDLLITEARRIKRVASDVPVHEIIIGDRPGDVAIGKLNSHLGRLPRKLGKDQVRALDVKLRAVANTSVPLPKGPLPTHMKRPKIR
jgi:hypothetical protein